MILDKENLFSLNQAVTATAASTDTIDLGQARDIGAGHPLPLLVQVTEDFDNLTSLKIDIEGDDDSGFGTAVVLASQTILLADLVAGRKMAIQHMPVGTAKRYLRLNYTVTGTAPTQGKITAGLVPAIENWLAYPGN